MDKANLVREGGKLLSDLLRVYLARPTKSASAVAEEETPSGEKTTVITRLKETRTSRPIRAKENTVGCRACTSKHFGKCSGALSEAIDFARDEGIKSEEVEKRLAFCEEQLDTWEGIDATPESYVNLSEEKKAWLREWLPRGRGLRHQLHAVKTMDDLEKAAAHAAQLHQKAWQELRELGEIAEPGSPFLDQVQRQAKRVKAGELTRAAAVKELQEWRNSVKA